MSKQLVFSVIGVVILFVALSWFYSQQRRKVFEDATIKANATSDYLKKGEIVLKELSFLGDLVEDKTISVTELKERAEKSIAILESHNTDGQLTKYIRETKEDIAAEVRKREDAKVK